MLDETARHNLTLDAIAHAQTIVRERHRAETDPEPMERLLSREYAALASYKVRGLAMTLILDHPEGYP